MKRAAGDEWLNLEILRKVFQDEINNLDSRTCLHDASQATASFSLKESKNESKDKSHCTLCDKFGHLWFRCRDYATPEKRIKRDRSKHLCTKCLVKDHFEKECKYRLKACFHCGNVHFYQLCTKNKIKVTHVTDKSGANAQAQSKVRTGD